MVKVNRVPEKRKSLRIFLIALLVAVFLVIITFFCIYLTGVRYLRKQTADGYVKFYGKVDKSGTPISGTLYYSDGLTGKIDSDNHRIVYSNGMIYEGELHQLQRSGPCTVIFPTYDTPDDSDDESAGKTVEKYVGTYENDVMTGEGTYYYRNGDTYVGSFKNGKKDGHGVYTRVSDNTTYDGEFKDDVRCGEGHETFADGSDYQGHYENDVKNGFGKLTFSGGDVYEGNFVNDIREGQGKYTWALSGDTYEGMFKKNLMNGWGKYTWSTGRIYEGVFENGVIVRIDNNETDTTQPQE